MKAPLFHSLRQSMAMLVLAASLLAASPSLSLQPTADSSGVASSQPAAPRSGCSGGTCG